MDRISALRNVENALNAFEEGEADLAATERRVAAALRTYATEFEGDGDVFRAVGEEPADGTVVVAPSKPAARERVLAALPEAARGSDADPTDADSADAESTTDPEFQLERV